MAQMGGVVIAIEVSFFFFLRAYAQKTLVYKGVTFPVIA